MEGRPVGTRPDRSRQRQPQRVPDNELNSAERGAAARRQTAGHLRHRRRGWRQNHAGGKLGRSENQRNAGKRTVETLAEKGDRAGMILVISLGVQGFVQVSAGGEDPQQPDRERAQHRHAAQGGGQGATGEWWRGGQGGSKWGNNARAVKRCAGASAQRTPPMRRFTHGTSANSTRVQAPTPRACCQK